MDYDEIITEYKTDSIDISNLKKQLEKARPLKARSNELDLNLIASTFHTIREGTNAQIISEKNDKIEIYNETVEKNLVQYYANIVKRINDTKAWGIMKVKPTKVTVDDFRELSISEMLKLVMALNKKYTGYLEVQKYADLRHNLINDEDLADENVRKMQFILTMFDGLKSEVAKKDFFCMPEELLIALINFRKSRYKRFEDYFNSKNKNIREIFESYSHYYNTEDFRNIIENISLVSKVLKIPVIKTIRYYSLISEINFEIRGLKEEYETFSSLQEKDRKMSLLQKEVDLKEIDELGDFIKEANNDIEEFEEESKENIEDENEQENQDNEDNTFEEIDTNTTEDDTDKNKNAENVKEQINPLIFAWFGRENRSLSDFVDAKTLSKFFDKIRQIQRETGIRVGLYIVTNAGKEIALNRMQELQHKARAKGLPKLVEGVLGDYSSYRIDNDGTITDIAIMDKEKRDTYIALLEKSLYDNGFKKDFLDPREENYLRYFFSIKRNPNITFQYLKNRIAFLLRDPEIKKEPLSFVPFIEGEYSGVDVLLKTQLEGIDDLSNYLKSKYIIAPGKTMKANILSLGKFTG